MFLLKNNVLKKVKKVVYFFDHQNVNFVCSHHHYSVHAGLFLSSFSISLQAFCHKYYSLIDYATYYQSTL